MTIVVDHLPMSIQDTLLQWALIEVTQDHRSEVDEAGHILIAGEQEEDLLVAISMNLVGHLLQWVIEVLGCLVHLLPLIGKNHHHQVLCMLYSACNGMCVLCDVGYHGPTPPPPAPMDVSNLISQLVDYGMIDGSKNKGRGLSRSAPAIVPTLEFTSATLKQLVHLLHSYKLSFVLISSLANPILALKYIIFLSDPIMFCVVILFNTLKMWFT